MKRRNQKTVKYIRAALLGLVTMMVVVCWQNMESSGDAPALQEILRYAQSNLYMAALKTHMPAVTAATGETQEQPTFREYFMDKIMELLPVTSYAYAQQEYDTQVESTLSYEMLVAREGMDEKFKDGELVAEGEAASEGKNPEQDDEGKNQSSESQEGGTADGGSPEADAATQTSGTAGGQNQIYPSVAQPAVQISREKLNDFDYLVQNFYVVDKTTTIDGGQLNAQELLAKDMHLATTADQPQILIHHTHSQERYADSNGDPSTSIVGVGDYLTKILTEQYGFHVIHDTGEYDVIDHDNAYSYAGPAVEQILAENPSIEVVIDMHRDGIEDGHLVTEVNGKQTAQIMFFNGLSRTTSNGELGYLYNPYIQDNLAFSLQMKLAGEEYYPGFTRSNYLKGYRYNLHYRPKSMLVEVGAQTNTVQEAMNAMEPLADLLHKILSP